MKKTIFLLSFGLLAAATAPAVAQKTKIKVKTDGPAPAMEAVEAAASGSPQTTKTIPVAEYYEGGQEAMYAFIDQELKYPVTARRNRIQGQCIVSFTLNTDGTLSGVKLVKQIGGGCGEEALRIVKLLKFKNPDYAILTSLPITFKL
ncbi:energy transducer TonB [Hymenobacter amundsenii]|uniref:Energy transducer TonB n=1 Tax=Hymenobacter amundsenii TaxID=2006685 RepID=A0A246FJA1_9BACT|nr:energy transducer TonB [Hymenobacter amundsenii]OWP62628.1 energy transducer TonB [Hymenobacter amundsenii]